MNNEPSNSWAAKKCRPCSDSPERLSSDAVRQAIDSLAGWSLTSDGRRIFKEWRVKDFMAGMRFFERVAQLAEAQGHHPDLHLSEYRHVRIEVWTHDAGGLTENDFILAAKIDQLSR